MEFLLSCFEPLISLPVPGKQFSGAALCLIGWFIQVNGHTADGEYFKLGMSLWD